MDGHERRSQRLDLQTHLLLLTGSVFVGTAALLIISSYLPQFDSAANLVSENVFSLDSGFKLFTTWRLALIRWDAFHFLHVAEHGYMYEYEWAFLPGVPRVIRASTRAFGLLPPTMKFDELQYALMFIAMLVVMLLTTSTLYKLSLHTFHSRSFALLAATLSLLSSSPVATRQTPYYGEPFFGLLSYQGILLLAKGHLYPASFVFALAGMFRSQGFMLGGFLIWDMIAEPILSYRAISPITLVKCLSLVGLTTVPFVHHQYTAFKQLCVQSKTPAEFCERPLPLIYSYAQSKYWDVGFLRYWTIEQIPNFIIAAPVLALLLYSSLTHIYIVFLPRLRARLHSFSQAAPITQKPSAIYSQPVNSPLFSPKLTPHAIHAFILTCTLLFSAHTQIILRLSPSLPFLYWSAASLWIDKPFWGKMWVGWSILWGVASVVVWAVGFPPA